MKIDKPGFYFDMPSATYLADPVATPSLTQSLAKILLDRSPLHAWYASPALNPDYQPDNDTRFDVGNISHTLLIGRGKEIEVLDYPDWRTKDAQKARVAAAEAGKLAVLGRHYAKADRMVKAAREQLDLRGLSNLFTNGGAGEVCMVWQDSDIWCRQLVDWLSADSRTFVDFKTTDMSAAPDNLGRMMVNAGWMIQAAMAECGLDVLDPENAGRRQYLFVVQETDPPYALNVVAISEAALTMGRKRLRLAFDIWRECIEADRWPGYSLDIVTPEIPGWAEARWLDREIAHAERGERHVENLGAG